jgi:predicted amidohydrolase
MRVAVAQMRSGTTPGPNLETIAGLSSQAKAEGAVYLVTPEMSVAFAADRAGLTTVAEPFEGNSAVARCSEIARETGLVLHIGSMAVASGYGRFANRSVVLRPDGTVAATYDKIHLFDADPPDSRPYRESATYEGGQSAVVLPLGEFKLGLSICYDVRFPRLYHALAMAGADVLPIPSAFTVPTGEAHWEVLLRARAIETGSYVLAAAQAGKHENGRATWGRSMVVDPWGSIVAKLDHDEPGLLVVDLDPRRVTDARGRIPALANSREFSLSVNEHGAS